MMNWHFVRSGLGLAITVGLVIGANLVGRADQPQVLPADKIVFENHVVPILQAHCFKCHGAELRKAGLDLRRRSAMLIGGDSGAAIVPGAPAASLLIEMLTSKQMPPEEEKPLAEHEVETLKRWIAAGARVREKEEPAATADEADVSAEDRAFWAFQPPVRPPVPESGGSDRVVNPIDAFVLARLRQAGGDFNPEASKRTLIRRLHIDLLGLPPSPDDVAAFLADERPDAYERLVDRLLASPRVGERWGRHWLDVAGYADSDGYLEADRLRPEAWRYRDYVIRSINADKPFDRFILEQIAGDEITDWRRADELTADMAEGLVATGFLRTAMDPTYGIYAEPLECYKVMADTMQIVGTAFLGLTVQCARCHAHKFDPISQRDYYRLHAVFLASYDPDRWQVSASRGIPLATEAEQARINQANSQVDARVKQLTDAIAALTDRYRDKFLAENFPGLTDPAVRAEVKAALLVEEKARNDAQKQLVAQHAAGVTLTDAAVGERFPEFPQEIAKLKAVIDAENALKKNIVLLRSLQDLGDSPAAANVLIRGDPQQRGRQVEPGAPAVLTSAGFDLAVQPGHKTTGRRLAFARWLVDEKNPLTARIHVNRVWAQHFGRGLVETLDNFGKAGSPPSHPELLDWLATEFIRSGWSQKELNRLILTSATWRQDSRPNPALAATDPDNRLLGSFRPRRLEGEALRDGILNLTERLNRAAGGPPVDVSASGTGQVTVAASPQGDRASVYLIVRRSQPVTLLDLFDTPKMEINCAQRVESVVVTQSLALLHSNFVETQAGLLADRLGAGTATATPEEESARLTKLYELLFARPPSEVERSETLAFLAEVQRLATTPPVSNRDAWAQLCLVLLNSNEFLFVD